MAESESHNPVFEVLVRCIGCGQVFSAAHGISELIHPGCPSLPAPNAEVHTKINEASIVPPPAEGAAPAPASGAINPSPVTASPLATSADPDIAPAIGEEGSDLGVTAADTDAGSQDGSQAPSSDGGGGPADGADSPALPGDSALPAEPNVAASGGAGDEDDSQASDSTSDTNDAPAGASGVAESTQDPESRPDQVAPIGSGDSASDSAPEVTAPSAPPGDAVAWDTALEAETPPADDSSTDAGIGTDAGSPPTETDPAQG